MDQQEPEIEQLSLFLRRFNDESDRSSALTAGAMLEDRLGEILRSFLIAGQQTESLLNGFSAPLGTLSSRIAACYSLGLIDSEEFEEMQTIRKIRNAFAHDWNRVSFEEQSVSDMCNNLTLARPS